LAASAGPMPWYRGCSSLRPPRSGKHTGTCHKLGASSVLRKESHLAARQRVKMKKGTTTYWLATAFVAFIMIVSGTLAISHAPFFMKALAHLGYPPYFSNLLGIGKIAGVCVLLSPGLAKLKEWAYVAFGITVLSACYSHFNAGDGLLALEPLVTFAALMISYLTRPPNRTFPSHQKESMV
jgi:hypothetical protein